MTSIKKDLHVRKANIFLDITGLEEKKTNS
jgi:hypothetical protein